MLTETPQWHALKKHAIAIKAQHLCELFDSNPLRNQQYTQHIAGLSIDFSRNLITAETLNLLFQFAHSQQIIKNITAMVTGELVNTTEKRAALHTALRNISNVPVMLEGKNVMHGIQACLEHMQLISNKIRDHKWLGYSQKPITDVVNIGIGGSDLGPRMAVNALTAFANTTINVHFVSNLDPIDIEATLKHLNPETTLFIISSKSFTTLETLSNAKIAMEWLNHPKAVATQCLAITAHPMKAQDLGITAEHILPMWDWVGGRFSVWSAIGLPLCIAIAYENFEKFLAGAHHVDQHILSQPLPQNIPIILALIDMWYINFFNTETKGIIPYSNKLSYLVPYLQQLIMESNGKSCDVNGNRIDFNTSSIIWGGIGSNSAHAFHQLLMQGSYLIPVEFIVSLHSETLYQEHHKLLIKNCYSQAQALLYGNLNNNIPYSHRSITGNQPSNIITLDTLNPYNLGALLALYEHRTVATAMLWGVNAFDQFGVELAKTM